jgi:hypothetical protein
MYDTETRVGMGLTNHDLPGIGAREIRVDLKAQGDFVSYCMLRIRVKNCLNVARVPKLTVFKLTTFTTRMVQKGAQEPHNIDIV